MNKDKKQKFSSFREKVLKRKYVSIFFALFTLGVNIFAWFAYSANASLSLDATISSWDVEFKENGVVTNQVDIDITNMLPGMADYERSIEILNNGDVEANFTYEIDSVELLGNTLTFASTAEAENYLENSLPFSINFTHDLDVIPVSGSVNFDVLVTWPYTINTTTYYKVDNNYAYDVLFTYYDSSHNVVEIGDAADYETKKSNLYLEKDDADTYFGMACGTYESTTGDPCLSLHLTLRAEQKLT